MKSQLIHQLLQPWNIGREHGPRVIGLMLRDLLLSERPAENAWGDVLPVMTKADGVARIPITGALSLNVPQWAKNNGINMTDSYDIEQELADAVADPAVSMIVYDIDSPGGLSVAGEALYDMTEVANKKKPVFAYTRDLCCSAAYQCAAPSVAILCGPRAEVGSIGTYCVYEDDSKFMEQMGITLEVFKSGKFKAMGLGPLTDEERVILQGRVDSIGKSFRAGVSKYRTGIDPADMEGQTFTGADAARRGFVAGIAPSYAAAVAKFRKLV